MPATQPVTGADPLQKTLIERLKDRVPERAPRNADSGRGDAGKQMPSERTYEEVVDLATRLAPADVMDRLTDISALRTQVSELIVQQREVRGVMLEQQRLT